MNSRPKQPKYARNKNILVIGGSGSGKTRFFVKPSLMQCTSKDFPTSYIVTDPKGTLILETGKMLQRYKYRIKVLNTINFKKSMKYNPFAYLRSEKDILKLVNTIIANTKGDGEKSGEDFWVKAEKLYYTALIGYIWYEAPEDEKNFTTLLEMINASEAREDDEDFQNPVDLMFERLEEKDPEHFAVKQYKKYKLAAGKTAKSILISCGADASAKLLHLGDGFTAAFSSIAPSFHPADLALGIAGAVIVRLIIYTKGKNAKKYRRGTEYGSARWGGADDIKPYTDPVFENNIPLTQTERLTMNSRPKQPKYARNKNILVIGGSGSGKTRFFVKPSLMQCTSKDFPTSYIVTDPKGTLILETGKMLQRYKYRIKVLNTINFLPPPFPVSRRASTRQI